MDRNLHALGEALRSLPEAAATTAVVPLSTGHSNETYLLEGADLILRLPPRAEPLLEGLGVLAQAETMRVVAAADNPPPVPRIIYVDNGSLIGTPFFLMERIKGEMFGDYEVPDCLSTPDDSFRDSLSAAYVGAIVDVHNVAPIEPFGAPVTPLEELQRWRRLAARAGNHELLEVMDRLSKLPAPVSGPPSVVHGDPKPGNALWDGSRLAALLDWEMGYNGEPLGDLGYMLFFFASDDHRAFPSCDVPGIWNRERIVAAWEEGTGRSASGVAWHEAAAITKIAAILSHGKYLYDSGQSTDERMGGWGEHVSYTVSLSRAMTTSLFAD